MACAQLGYNDYDDYDHLSKYVHFHKKKGREGTEEDEKEGGREEGERV